MIFICCKTTAEHKHSAKSSDRSSEANGFLLKGGLVVDP